MASGSNNNDYDSSDSDSDREQLDDLDERQKQQLELELERRNYNNYLALFKGQTEKYRHIRVVFTGKEGSGKTTVCLRLRNENVNLMSRQPTEGAALYPVWFSINRDSKQWKNNDGHSLEKVIKIRMGTLMKKIESSAIPIKSADKTVDSTTSLTPEGIQEASDVRRASFGQSFDETFLSMWDMGGHVSFQASHNIFISSHGVYLLVFRLTDFLRDKLETDRLKKWIRLIGTFSTDVPNLRTQRIQAPPIIFVGTFLDELKKTYQDYNKQIADIRKSITKFPELSTLRFVRFCTVDNSLGNDDEELEKLRDIVTEAAEYQDQWERELPTTWLKFELDLFNARGKGTNILGLAEVIEMNQRSLAPLKDEDEIKLALEYLHSTRSVIYFREFDYVITEPQWLVDFFSILITDDQFLPVDDILLNRDLELYNRKGALTKKLIKGLLCMGKNKAFAPFQSVLLALMEKFGLMVKIMLSKNAAESQQFSETYFIPSKFSELQNIDKITDEITSLKRRRLAVSKTLCFVFEDVYVPFELFHRIFAKILWEYRITSLPTQSLEEAAVGSESTTEKTHHLSMNFGCFEVNDICRMILSMHAERSTIAVTVLSPTESKLPAGSGKSIRLSIERILQETLEMSNQQHFHYSHQLHCNFHLSPYDTPVQLYGIIHSERGVACKGGECQGQHSLSKTDIQYWDVTEDSSKIQEKDNIADEIVSDNVSSDDMTREEASNFNRRPTPQELGRLSRLIDTSSCERLFCELSLPYPDIQATVRDSAWMASSALVTKLFLKWTNAYPNQTFNHIKHAMTEVGMATDRILETVKTEEETISEDIVPHEVLSRLPSGDEIKKIPAFIGCTFFNLFLELGLSPPVIEQHILYQSHDFSQKLTALLQCWKEKNKRQATIGRLLSAMKLCQMDWYTTAEIFAACQEKDDTGRERTVKDTPTLVPPIKQRQSGSGTVLHFEALDDKEYVLRRGKDGGAGKLLSDLDVHDLVVVESPARDENSVQKVLALAAQHLTNVALSIPGKGSLTLRHKHTSDCAVDSSLLNRTRSDQQDSTLHSGDTVSINSRAFKEQTLRIQRKESPYDCDSLHHLVLRNDIDELKRKLLDHETVDVNAKDEAGWTALSLAILLGKCELVKILLYNGANTTSINAQILPTFVDGDWDRNFQMDLSPLILSVRLNLKDIVELLTQENRSHSDMAICIKMSHGTKVESVLLALVCKEAEQKYSDINAYFKPTYTAKQNKPRVCLGISDYVCGIEEKDDIYGVTIVIMNIHIPQKCNWVKNPGLMTENEEVVCTSLINLRADELWDQHPNLNAITAGMIANVKYPKREPTGHIILHCSHKGYIPLESKPFPFKLELEGGNTMPVAVVEGKFRFSPHQIPNASPDTTVMYSRTNNSKRHPMTNVRHLPLKIGMHLSKCPKHGSSMVYEGTLGPFVDMINGKKGFITCAHLFYKDELSSEYQSIHFTSSRSNCGDDVIAPFDHYQEIVERGVSEMEVDDQHVDDDNMINGDAYWECGKIVQAVFDPTEETGIDAALVEIDPIRVPLDGSFDRVSHSHLQEADMSHPPLFNSGKQADKEYLASLRSGQPIRCMKLGASSGLTVGALTWKNGQVRTDDACLAMENDSTRTYIMKGQFVISNFKNVQFFRMGDSGSAVFVMKNSNDTDSSYRPDACLGVAIGFSEDETFVTPIGSILQKFNSNNAEALKLTEFK